MALTVLQISDCHLGDQAGETLLGLNTDESLLAVLSLINDICPQPDLVAFTGDISNSGGPGAYARLIDIIQTQTSFSAPIIWLPGNHDDNHDMQHEVGEGFLASKGLGKWQVSCLDSSIPKAVPGAISAAELQRSVDILESNTQQHHLFFIHHHLQAVNCAWLDSQVITNADEVMAAWGQYPQLKIVAHGHVHQVKKQVFSHVDIVSAPSTCIQFKPNSDEFSTGKEMPGFRIFTLHDDGSYETQVHRISERDLGIDLTISSY